MTLKAPYSTRAGNKSTADYKKSASGFVLRPFCKTHCFSNETCMHLWALANLGLSCRWLFKQESQWAFQHVLHVCSTEQNGNLSGACPRNEFQTTWKKSQMKRDLDLYSPSSAQGQKERDGVQAEQGDRKEVDLATHPCFMNQESSPERTRWSIMFTVALLGMDTAHRGPTLPGGTLLATSKKLGTQRVHCWHLRWECTTSLSLPSIILCLLL